MRGLPGALCENAGIPIQIRLIQQEGEAKMKIAVPARQGLVDAHFGHCDHFMVYSLGEGREIAGEEKVDSPNGCGCKSDIAGVLARMGVTHMVAGNMGDGAVRVLQARGIEVVRGATGNARQAAELFAAGRMTDSAEACVGHGSGHTHGHECGHAD
jgi:predicted Fe-Mo cluster-binding NifX family protein